MEVLLIMTKILVVDDDLNICELLRMYLEKEGYEVKMRLSLLVKAGSLPVM